MRKSLQKASAITRWKYFNYIKFLIFNALLLVTLWFVWQRFNLTDFELFTSKVDYSLLLLSVLWFLASYLCLSVSWLIIVKLYTEEQSKPASTALTFGASQVFKYLPSNLFTFSARIYFTNKLNIPVAKILKALVFEAGIMILSSFAVFAWYSESWLLVGLVIPGFAVVFAPKYLSKLPFAGKVFSYKLNMQTAKYIINAIFASVLAWICGGIAYSFFAMSLGEFHNLNDLIAQNSLSYTASILAIFAPGGLGVKELVLSYSDVGDSVIIFWRIITLLIDVFVSVFAILALWVLSKNWVIKTK